MENRPALQDEPLTAPAVGHPEYLVVDGFGVHDADRATDREGTDGSYPWCRGVFRLIVSSGDDPAAQPAGALPGDERRPVRCRDVQDHITRAVEPARVVAIDLALNPVSAVPRLPHQRRIPGIDANPADGALHAQNDRAGRNGIGQPDEQRFPGSGALREARYLLPVFQRAGLVGNVSAGRLGCDAVQLAGQDAQVADGAEDDRFFDIRARSSDLRLRAHQDGSRLRRRQPEGDGAGRRGGREQVDAEQIQELDVVLVRHPVQPVDQLIDHLRERLDQRHPGVGDVMVSPFRAALLDQALGVVDQVPGSAGRRDWAWAAA